MLVAYLRIKFHVPSSSTSLVIANKLSTINRLQSSHTAILRSKSRYLKKLRALLSYRTLLCKKETIHKPEMVQEKNGSILNTKNALRGVITPPPPPSILTILEGAVVIF